MVKQDFPTQTQIFSKFMFGNFLNSTKKFSTQLIKIINKDLIK
jgi:hypothetical protein